MGLKGFYLDIEADGLYLQSTKIWYMRLSSLDRNRSVKVYPFRDDTARQQVLDFINSFEDKCYVVFHNGYGFDVWAMWRHLNITPRVGKQGSDWIEGKPVTFVDTYVLSMFLNPDLPKHSLAYLASGSEDEKMDYRQALIDAGAMSGDEPKGHEFSFYHPIMDTYCDDDVKAGIGVFFKLWKQATDLYTSVYGEGAWPHNSFRQVSKDYWLYQAQAHTGKYFHKDRAEKLVAHIEEKMAEIRAEVEPHLPPRPLKTAEQAFYRIPAKPFKKDGSFSSTMEKWLERHNAKVYYEDRWYVEAYGKESDLVPGEILPVTLPMEIDDNDELKDWFMREGWVPHDDFWNFKNGPDGKKMRDEKGKYIKTTPKIQNAGVICPNLLKMEADIPKKVVKFLSYRNRLGIVQGWLNNWRLSFDGRLSAEISGYTPTSRVKHRTVVNVPKASEKVLLGAEMRDLFGVEEGKWFIGCDASALENRTLAAYTFKYDDGWFAKMNLEGDIHTHNAFVFFPELHSKFDKNKPDLKEDKAFKPWRDKAKTGAYLLAFGGGAPKLASSLGLPKARGKQAYDDYWEGNKGLGLLKKAVERYYNTTGKGKFIPGKDGRLVSVRGANVLLSCLGQGLGAIAMSHAACFMDTWLGEMYIDEKGRPFYLYKGKQVKRISMVHDEYSWEVEDGIQEGICQFAEKGIVKAGEYLKMEVALAAEAKMAYNGTWKDVH